jgi:hypothetical protein
MRLRLLAVILACLSSGPAQAAPVYLDTVTNLEWRQVKDTVGFSFNQMNTDTNGTPLHGCSASTGVCSGNLGGSGPSLDGWRWATEEEVRTLFHDFAGSLNIPGFDPLPLTATAYSEVNSPWAPAIIDTDVAGIDAGIFDATLFNVGTSTAVGGLTRSLVNPGIARAGLIGDVVSTDLNDIASSGVQGPGTGTSSLSTGFWLLRDASPSVVPVPTTLLLLATGVAFLGWRRRASDWNRRRK